MHISGGDGSSFAGTAGHVGCGPLLRNKPHPAGDVVRSKSRRVTSRSCIMGNVLLQRVGARLFTSERLRRLVAVELRTLRGERVLGALVTRGEQLVDQRCLADHHVRDDAERGHETERQEDQGREGHFDLVMKNGVT